MLHDEADSVAAFAATETLIDFFGGRNGKGWRLFIMKRTQAEVAGAPFFQFYKLSDYINDIDAAQYLLYGILTYQFITPSGKR